MSRPTIPQYNTSPTKKRPYCTSEQPTEFIISSGSDALPVDVRGGVDTEVDDISNQQEQIFVVNHSPYTALSLSLTVVVLSSSQQLTLPVLKGTTVDQLNLTWSYNKPVSSQNIIDSGPIPDVVLNASQRAINIVTSLTEDATLTLSGDDGAGRTGSVDSETFQIQFGNYFAHTVTTDLIGLNQNLLQNLYDNAQRTVKRARQGSFFPSSVANQHDLVIYPKSWGLGTFTKGIFEGGFVRLKNVAGELKSIVGQGETETDIILNNGNGFSEAFYVYQSLIDFQQDTEVPFIIS